MTYSFRWTLYLFVFISEAASRQFFFNINYFFSDQGKVGHHTSIFTETKVHLVQFFAATKAFLVMPSQLLRTKKKVKSIFMQLHLCFSQNSGYTLFQLFQDMISHERRDLSSFFKIRKIIYSCIQQEIIYLKGNSGLLWLVLKHKSFKKSSQIRVL